MKNCAEACSLMVTMCFAVALVTLVSACGSSTNSTPSVKSNQAIQTSGVAPNIEARSKKIVNHVEHSFSFVTLPDNTYYNVSATRLLSALQRGHYIEKDQIDNFNARIVRNIVEQIDPHKNLLTKADMQAWIAMAPEPISAKDFYPYYVIMDKAMAKVQAKIDSIDIVISNLNGFKKPKRYLDTRTKVRFENKQKLDLYWQRKVQNDGNNLLLLSIPESGIKEHLSAIQHKRKRMRKKLDVNAAHKFFLNAIAQAYDSRSNYIPPISGERERKLANIFAQPSKPDPGGVPIDGTPSESELKVVTILDEARVLSIEQSGKTYSFAALEKNKYQAMLNNASSQGTMLTFVSHRSESGIEKIQIPKSIQGIKKWKIKTEYKLRTTTIGSASPVGVIAFDSFYQGLTEDARKSLDAFEQQNIKSVIIDLRGNGGGSLVEGVDFSGLFLDDRNILQIETDALITTSQLQKSSKTDPGSQFSGQVIVLVDYKSAGASEIFAAAMQDYGRGIVVGQSTYGLGKIAHHRSLGRIYDIFDEKLGSVQYTVGQYFRITGEKIHHTGVTPDVLLTPPYWQNPQRQGSDEHSQKTKGIGPANYQKIENLDENIQTLKTLIRQTNTTDNLQQALAMAARLGQQE